jgi:MFS family permease
MIQVAVGLAWTLLPLYFKSLGLRDKIVLASITTTFNAIRGVVQLFSGTLSDFLGARVVCVVGFFLCGLSFILSAAIPNANSSMPSLISLWVGCGALLGIGVGGVYPVMGAEVGKFVPSQDRDAALCVFRFWRELGYAFGGGISVTILTEQSIATCVIIIGVLMLATALVIAIFYGPDRAQVKVLEEGVSPKGIETVEPKAQVKALEEGVSPKGIETVEPSSSASPKDSETVEKGAPEGGPRESDVIGKEAPAKGLSGGTPEEADAVEKGEKF